MGLFFFEIELWRKNSGKSGIRRQIASSPPVFQRLSVTVSSGQDYAQAKNRGQQQYGISCFCDGAFFRPQIVFFPKESNHPAHSNSPAAGTQRSRSYRFALIFSIIAAYSLSLSLTWPGFMAKTPPHS